MCMLINVNNKMNVVVLTMNPIATDIMLRISPAGQDTSNKYLANIFLEPNAISQS